MANVTVSKIVENRMLRPTREAVYLDGVDVVEVSRNTLQF